MSAAKTTVGELRRMLDKYPDDMLVVVPATCETGEWRDEGTTSGLDGLYTIHLWEVRTGWHVIHPDETDPECDQVAVIIGDVAPMDLLEAQDEVFGGPSPFAARKRPTWACKRCEGCGPLEERRCWNCDGKGKVWR